MDSISKVGFIYQYKTAKGKFLYDKESLIFLLGANCQPLRRNGKSCYPFLWLTKKD